MMVETNIDVLSIPNGLLNRFRVTIDKDELKPIQDPDGDWIIGMQLLDDLAWTNLLNTREGQPQQSYRNRLNTKKYKFEEVEI